MLVGSLLLRGQEVFYREPLWEAVYAPSLEVLKAELDGALSNLVWWEVALTMGFGTEWPLRFLPNHSVIP